MTFTRIWRAKWICNDATSLAEMADALLREWGKRSVRLDVSPVTNDCAFLATDDATVAQQLDFDEKEENEWDE